MVSRRYRANRSVGNKLLNLQDKVIQQQKTGKTDSIASQAITDANIADGTIQGVSLDDRTVTSEKIARGAITTSNLGIINTVNSDASMVLRMGGTGHLALEGDVYESPYDSLTDTTGLYTVGFDPTDNAVKIFEHKPIFNLGDINDVAVAGATGAQVLSYSDVTDTWSPVTLSSGAPLDSPAFTGTPTAPTATKGTATTQLATTKFVQDADPGYSYKSGYYYETRLAPVSTTLGSLIGANDMWFHPQKITSTVTIQSIAITVHTAVASSTMRLGIYADDGSGSPGALVLDAGAVSTATTGAKTITVSQQLTSGVYWFAVWSSSGVPGVHMYNMATNAFLHPEVGNSSAFASTGLVGYNINTTYGTYPSTFPTATWTQRTTAIRVQIRAA